jgi:RNA polymerase sigma factor (sigma-70 family)
VRGVAWQIVRAECNVGHSSCIVVGVAPDSVSSNAEPLEARGIGRDEFESLYRREHGPMLRLAVLLVGSRSVAEEIVQDAFAVTTERWATLSNPGGYLRGCVVNGCRMALRRRATESRIELNISTVIDGPTELIELQDALRRLSERQRIVIVLRYFLDLPDKDIAPLLGARVATVRSLAHRALRVLRKELA